ncbi:MAG TPA: FtsX-like permease family protein [Candidatus Koribacter sp.]|jgi:predicted permease
MARSAAREREFAVRAALGASRSRLVQQSLIEALTLALAGAITGIGFAYILLRSFLAIAPDGMPYLTKAALDLRILIFTLFVSLFCGLLCGLIAALHKPPAEALAGHTTMSAPHAHLRQSLVILQIAASLVLLSGGALLVRSFVNLERQRLGINPEHLVTATISLGQLRYPDPQKQMAFFLALERSLEYGPGISMLAVSDTVPPGGYHHDQIYAPITINGVRQTGGTGGLVAWRWVSPDYFRTFNIPLLEGQGFTEDQRTSPNHFLIVSQSLGQRMFPAHDPIGQHVQLAAGAPDDPIYTVVGVVGDVKNAGLAGTDMPEYYRLRRDNPDDWNRLATFTLKTNLPLDTVAKFVRTQTAALDPTLPVEIQALSQRVHNLADRPLFETSLVGLFAATGVLMAIIGLYGVIAFLVARRTQEIGLRMAMGATRADILRLVVGSGLRLILPGAILGILAALAVSRVLASALFHVSPHDPFTFSLVSLLLLIVSVLATLIPAITSAQLNPMDALRCD